MLRGYLADDDSIFTVFDILPLADFRRGYWNAQLSKRIDILEAIRPVIDKMPNVELLPHLNVDLDTAEGQSQFKRYSNDMVAAGFEGIMIKDPLAVYECDRTVAWLKIKPFIEVSLEVQDVEVGTGKNAGRLGALVCEGVDDGQAIRVNVGSGFTDDLRNSIWLDRTSVIGQVVEVRADAVTQNQDGTYSLRFPRFLRFRGFEPGEKL